MNIQTYLDGIRNESDGEGVINWILDTAELLNKDDLVDILVEKLVIQTDPRGKVIRKAIARMLSSLARYTPDKRIVILTQDEYDNLAGPSNNTLYLIRLENRCFGVTLDANGYYDPNNHCCYAPGTSSSWWEDFPRLLWTMDGFNNGIGNWEVFVGQDYEASEVFDEMFKNSKLQRITLDMPNYTIGSLAFSGCDKLRKASLGSGVTAIASNAFSGCSNLNIIIDKAEDSVLGAPWGAQNASVIWTG